MKPVNYTKMQGAWMAFIILNIFTIPLSPVAGGLMTRESYMWIMYIKLVIIIGLTASTIILWQQDRKYLKSLKDRK
jgi:hypothetical protein